MRVLMVIGIALILAGIAGLVVNYVPIHHREEVARIGSLKATVNERKDIFIPPYASVIVIVVGAGLVLAGAQRRA